MQNTRHCVRPCHRAHTIAALATTLLLCACASQHTAPSEREITAAREEAQALAQRGYRPPNTFAVDHFAEAWNGPNGTLLADVLMPRDAGNLPVVLYLPSGGGPADEGERWRRAWAESGYAVISLQSPKTLRSMPRSDMPPDTSPPPHDMGKQMPPGAGNDRNDSDGYALRRDIAVPAAVAARLALARFALAEIANRAAQRRTPFDRMNISRLAVTGFDLGADTAMALAGANTGTDPTAMPPSSANVKAVLALSPYVDTARANPARVYASIGRPVLTVTGTEDADRQGWVDDPHMRLAPYTFMPPGAKGLLVLDQGVHETLAGSLQPTARAPRNDSKETKPNSGERHHRSSDQGPGSGGMGGSGMGNHGGGMRADGEKGGPHGEDERPMIEPYAQYVLVEQVTTAYLDAYVKEDPIALEWLTRNAARWMGGRAQWQMK